MGVSSKKQTTTTQSQGTSNSTPNVPQWGVDSLQDLNSKIAAIAKTDPTTYVTPASSLQQQAMTGASNLGGWQQGNADASSLAKSIANAGASTIGPAAHVDAASVLDNGGIARYLSPYLKDVVDSSLADFDQSAGETRARQAAQGAAANAFGGDRWGIQEAETEGQLARARGSLDSGLRNTGWTQAAGLAGDDANRRQAASAANAAADNRNSEFNAGEKDTALTRSQGVAGLLGGLADSLGAGQRSDIGVQETLGDTQRGISQALATAPISLAQTVAALLGQNQLPLLTGETTNSSGTSTGTTTSTPSVFGQIGNGISTAAKLAALFG